MPVLIHTGPSAVITALAACCGQRPQAPLNSSVPELAARPADA